mmetsp:Transcript_17539/g.43741  ORF Transcript_17539/g.43741 Transcript_17539/m.43741 type:complete len:342 (-) Transcript_17539:2297-3322(-)
MKLEHLVETPLPPPRARGRRTRGGGRRSTTGHGLLGDATTGADDHFGGVDLQAVGSCVREWLLRIVQLHHHVLVVAGHAAHHFRARKVLVAELGARRLQVQQLRLRFRVQLLARDRGCELVDPLPQVELHRVVGIGQVLHREARLGPHPRLHDPVVGDRVRHGHVPRRAVGLDRLAVQLEHLAGGNVALRAVLAHVLVLLVAVRAAAVQRVVRAGYALAPADGLELRLLPDVAVERHFARHRERVARLGHGHLVAVRIVDGEGAPAQRRADFRVRAVQNRQRAGEAVRVRHAAVAVAELAVHVPVGRAHPQLGVRHRGVVRRPVRGEVQPRAPDRGAARHF